MKFSSALLVLTTFTLAACSSASHKVTAVGPVPPPPPAAQTQAAAETAQIGVEEIERRVLVVINTQRSSNGLKPLEASPELARSAQAHSDKMLSGKFLSTRGPDEPSVIVRMTSIGVKTMKLGENVVRIKTHADNVAEETVAIWMGTSSDRKNVLSSAFTKTGVGTSRAADGDYYITEDFAQ